MLLAQVQQTRSGGTQVGPRVQSSEFLCRRSRFLAHSVDACALTCTGQGQQDITRQSGSRHTANMQSARAWTRVYGHESRTSAQACHHTIVSQCARASGAVRRTRSKGSGPQNSSHVSRMSRCEGTSSMRGRLGAELPLSDVPAHGSVVSKPFAGGKQQAYGAVLLQQARPAGSSACRQLV